ncbi:uncharacterized protein EI90DRAFT_3066877 [Cantharellus anzutake]|uniref:uncharacterized protein n=1 Tax=Cantharellus anzutake TaxID=1750568 RepID=UPI0019084538|nr:uncharacterized protein EI90DRAFT_3066877 [Cantharellus anzutake]KAF8327748.1 hypothetical protein EI90DRAFT_3066877 [Cantharellus anzutake]
MLSKCEARRVNSRILNSNEPEAKRVPKALGRSRGPSMSWLMMAHLWLFGLSLASASFARSISAEGRWIKVAQHGVDSPSFPPCARQSYLGAYGHPLRHVFATRQMKCLDEAQADLVAYIEPRDEPFTLIWLQDSGVDVSIRQASPLEEWLSDPGLHLRTRAQLLKTRAGLHDETQHPIGSVGLDVGIRLEWFAQTHGILSIDNNLMGYLDTLIPPYVSAVGMTSPFSEDETGPFLPVPQASIERVRALIEGLRFNPDVASILSTLSVKDMTADIMHLTGEDGGGILTRHSFSEGALVAADWIQKQFEETGAICHQKSFLVGFSPNIICRYEGTGNGTSLVLLSAHYDSRGSYGSTRAPGANDDGSGVTHLLAIAKAIKSNKIKFKSPVELVAFSGEEQGLFGSQAYAKELREQGADITLMIQADMLAYHSPTEPMQLGLPEFIGLPEAAWLLSNVSKIYSPELTVGVTSACCSDHQSFHLEGFPATQVFERAGPILDPMYHNSGDLSKREGYDLQQVRSIAKVTFSSVLEAAGFVIDS